MKTLLEQVEEEEMKTNVREDFDPSAAITYKAELERQQLSPEKRLLLMVLKLGLSDYINKPTQEARRNALGNAKEWLLSDSKESIFSFASLCDTFSISRSKLRQRVMEMREQKVRFGWKEQNRGEGGKRGELGALTKNHPAREKKRKFSLPQRVA